MPVEQHAVHERVRIGSDWRYACWNRPDKFADGYYAPDRIYNEDGTWRDVKTFIPHTMSHDCRSDDSSGFCAGCRHHLASGYVKQIIGASKTS